MFSHCPAINAPVTTDVSKFSFFEAQAAVQLKHAQKLLALYFGKYLFHRHVPGMRCFSSPDF